MKTVADFEAEARRQLHEEDAAKFELRVKERVRLLREHARQAADGAVIFPHDLEGSERRLEELLARRKHLLGRRGLFEGGSAAEDAELDRIKTQLPILQDNIARMKRAA